MTRDESIALARMHGAWQPTGTPSDWEVGDIVVTPSQLWSFANALLEQERERICSALPGGYSVDPQWVADMVRGGGKTQAADEITRLRDTITEQKRTIECLMVGMPEDGTTPVIRRIAELERLLEKKSDAIQRLWHDAEALRAEVEALKADAERYRWLRSDSVPVNADCPAAYMMSCGATGVLLEGELDAAIDNAMKSEGEPK